MLAESAILRNEDQHCFLASLAINLRFPVTQPDSTPALKRHSHCQCLPCDGGNRCPVQMASQHCCHRKDLARSFLLYWLQMPVTRHAAGGAAPFYYHASLMLADHPHTRLRSLNDSPKAKYPCDAWGIASKPTCKFQLQFHIGK